MPLTGRQRPPDPVSSLFKQDLRTQLRWREGPAGDLPFYPIPKARGADHGVRGTPNAQEGDPFPRRPTRPRTGRYRPAGTFSTEDLSPPAAEEPERHAAKVAVRRQAGRIWAAGDGIEVKGRRRLPAELPVKFKAATGKQPRGKAPQARPSIRPHADESGFVRA
jgi:hypothetical protein